MSSISAALVPYKFTKLITSLRQGRAPRRGRRAGNAEVAEVPHGSGQREADEVRLPPPPGVISAREKTSSEKETLESDDLKGSNGGLLKACNTLERFPAAMCLKRLHSGLGVLAHLLCLLGSVENIIQSL
ncbi:UNVERIFIED_CONTAM: hypothetical protein K2H54_060890 [Gekko kuhli]